MTIFRSPIIEHEKKLAAIRRAREERAIITDPCPVGFIATREGFDLGDKIGSGKTRDEAIADLKEQEE